MHARCEADDFPDKIPALNHVVNRRSRAERAPRHSTSSSTCLDKGFLHQRAQVLKRLLPGCFLPDWISLTPTSRQTAPLAQKRQSPPRRYASRARPPWICSRSSLAKTQSAATRGWRDVYIVLLTSAIRQFAYEGAPAPTSNHIRAVANEWHLCSEGAGCRKRSGNEWRGGRSAEEAES
eukprot:1784787-Pleurochrysis_carterae.AAC.1